MVFEDVHAVRQQVLAEVEAKARQDGVKRPKQEDTYTACKDLITKAFIKARLFPKPPNANHQMMAASFAAQMAARLHDR